jgi:hypothetical protein
LWAVRLHVLAPECAGIVQRPKHDREHPVPDGLGDALVHRAVDIRLNVDVDV